MREDEDLDYAVVGNGIQSDYHEEEVISEDISEDIEQSASASD
ncbi:hypothetical protein SPONN_491 [uncultured Candidatus Thioglobus sp.]|nr:hypothetical protein SPONN_491 [uncultured Candidatus Thioglobus sp.]